MNFELPGQPGQMSMINLSDMLGKAMGGPPKKRRKLKVIEAATRLIEEEQDKRLDQDDVARVALDDAEAHGIVFLDENDKNEVSDVSGGSVTRKVTQSDLTPFVDGTTTPTTYTPPTKEPHIHTHPHT